MAETLLMGFRGDLITASLVVGLSVIVGALLWGLVIGICWVGRRVPSGEVFTLGLWRWFVCVGIFLLAFLLIDMGYYGYNHQHLDFVFFEYVDDLLTPSPYPVNQAFQQTDAELQHIGQWAVRVALFLMAEGILVVGWVFVFRRGFEPYLNRWHLGGLILRVHF